MALWLKWWALVLKLALHSHAKEHFCGLRPLLVSSPDAPINLGSRALYVLSLWPRSSIASCWQFFQCPPSKIDKLAALWMANVLASVPDIVRIKGRAILVGDAIKIGKEGLKMPAVKSKHQESDSDTKPSYIMGHSC